jgi:hypothetical protein
MANVESYPPVDELITVSVQDVDFDESGVGTIQACWRIDEDQVSARGDDWHDVVQAAARKILDVASCQLHIPRESLDFVDGPDEHADVTGSRHVTLVTPPMKSQRFDVDGIPCVWYAGDGGFVGVGWYEAGEHEFGESDVAAASRAEAEEIARDMIAAAADAALDATACKPPSCTHRRGICDHLICSEDEILHYRLDIEDGETLGRPDDE